MAYSLAKNKIKVLLLEGVHKSAVKLFRESGYSNVEYISGALGEAELAHAIRGVHLLGIRSRTFLTEKIISLADRLIAAGCFCIGTNQVDLSAAKKNGIPVFNAPFSNTRSVAELVIAEAIMLLRRIPEKNHLARLGGWDKSADNSWEIRGKTLGIAGYGHIGSQVSILAESLGMHVLYYDIEKKMNIGNARPVRSLKELCEKSHILTLHVPSTRLTRNMISKREIFSLPKGAIIINASRGDVVNIDDLAAALEKKHLSGAAVDVFPEEPAGNKDVFRTPLQKFSNVIITPHIGGSTMEAQENIALEVAEKLIAYSDTGTTTGAVNFVQVSLPANREYRRFLHIHSNTAGILQKINSCFSRRNINISAQYLQTDSDIGYVVCDIGTQVPSEEIISELKAVPGTIKTRWLV
ncbi:MAG: D-3-phosphoglycerate dehydrogenase [Spirochaetes bacterium GWF1_41_5]|nr:MAG: D-3-phosphoglycerate dehydrogenase [Spirochaetes bacterium GWF1_41_5]HBE03203.1 phosphoglycerate dehydrogenase [Spirochaetia bacterium]